MKLRRMRYLVVFLAMMFLANGVAAAARACIVELGGEEHAALQSDGAGATEHLCPLSGDAGHCLAHCTQSYKGEEQKLWIDVPGFVLTPAASAPRVWFQPEAAVPPLAFTPPVVGPPLTILFRNFRI